MMMLLTSWIAVLVAATVSVFNLQKEYLWVPSLVCWSAFGLFCMFAVTNALLPGEKNRSFWIGTAIFGTFYLLAVILANALYQPTIGRVISDVIVFNIDRDTADEITRMRCDSVRNMADVGLATLLAFVGGTFGRIHTSKNGG
ncbi:hypothetical protein MFFC18_20990 [Mariniblastus fucicola]|uniref:Uncharacterized protein n=2 Tax=Mariniblastus fucicola TaxID=980251 RepID=A0A5B9PHW1_9BACT|nr:hypothetical protein MFFC18_20990 [Mariniblastus fucicola]